MCLELKNVYSDANQTFKGILCQNCMNAFSIRPTFTTIIMMNSLSDMLVQNAFDKKTL